MDHHDSDSGQGLLARVKSIFGGAVGLISFLRAFVQARPPAPPARPRPARTREAARTRAAAPSTGPAAPAPAAAQAAEPAPAPPPRPATEPPEVQLRPGWSLPLPPALPPPSYWPSVLALAIVLLLWGLVSSIVVSGIGLGLFILAIAGWVGDLRHAE
jgi:hypothetical protein